jgi:hypothetical protein
MLNAPTPAARADQTLSLNMKLLAHHELGGFGGLGEGISKQFTYDGRRILWLAHEAAPKNFSGVDVTDPKNPRLIVQTDLPHMKLRSNSLDVVGNIMAVAYQATTVGIKPAGVDLFDVGTPEKPKLISHFDCSGPHSTTKLSLRTFASTPVSGHLLIPAGCLEMTTNCKFNFQSRN